MSKTDTTSLEFENLFSMHSVKEPWLKPSSYVRTDDLYQAMLRAYELGKREAGASGDK